MLVTMAKEDEKMNTLTKNTQTGRLSERLKRIRKRAREREGERVRQRVSKTESYMYCIQCMQVAFGFQIFL